MWGAVPISSTQRSSTYRDTAGRSLSCFLLFDRVPPLWKINTQHAPWRGECVCCTLQSDLSLTNYRTRDDPAARRRPVCPHVSPAPKTRWGAVSGRLRDGDYAGCGDGDGVDGPHPPPRGLIGHQIASAANSLFHSFPQPTSRRHRHHQLTNHRPPLPPAASPEHARGRRHLAVAALLYMPFSLRGLTEARCPETHA